MTVEARSAGSPAIGATSTARPPRHGDDARAGPAALARLRTFHTLDALRGIAALAVVLYHTAFFYGISPPPEGQLAVDLFFVMSGFIVAHRYEPDLRGGMSLGQFVRIRLIRLYPLFLLGMVLGVLPAAVDEAIGRDTNLHRSLLESFPLALLMLPSRLAMPTLTEIYPINYVAWSLALELAINLLYAASFRFWTMRRLMALLAVAFIALAVCVAVDGRLDEGYAWQTAYAGIARVLFGFPAGVLLARLYEKRAFVARAPWYLPVVLAIACFCFTWQREKGPWELFAITMLVPTIVAMAIATEPPPRLHRICAVAGLLSYPVYSLHAPFVSFFLRGEAMAHLDIRVQTHLDALVFTLLLASLCIAAQVLYDKPVRRFLSARTRFLVPPRVAGPRRSVEAAATSNL